MHSKFVSAKQETIKKYCESIVTLNTRLPFAIKLIGFLWMNNDFLWFVIMDEVKQKYQNSQSIS